ncbi:MAG: gliding motility-associated C-terminal domain-containing protein, partial [Saprospiraceae bacterium]|nr:gliding motility-associated C-terminal domain-containing protein [Saprospiraceae bacterium]
TDTDEVVVVLDDDIPVAERISTQNVRCFGETNGSITIDSISSDHPPVLISLNDEPFSLNQSFTDLAPGAYVISLQDAAGCEWTSDTLIIAEPPQLTADLGGEISVILGDSVRLDPQLEAPFESLASVQWSPLMDTLHRDTLLQEFLPLKSLYVSFSAIDTNGCSTTDRVKILVEKPEQVFIPNVIRPGSLTFNDVATVFGGRGVEEVLYFKIFDRWGEQMFEAKNFQPNDPTQGWSGQFRGESVPPGVYVYVASVKFIDGVEKIYKGDVTVVR